MSQAAAAARLSHRPEGLVGECLPCDVVLVQLPDFDRDVALGTFLQHHPMSAQAMHRPEVPAGWQPAPLVAAG